MADQRLLRLIPTGSFLGAVFGAAVPIPKATATDLEDGKRVWLQAAYEGEFKGYRIPMKLTAAFFAAMIANLRADPQFRAGDDGYGAQPVVRMDYEHASAMPPSEGSIPAQGAPAPGWVCDMEVRAGKEGRLELWALCELGTQLTEQIKAGEQRFLSIEAPLKSKDPVTGEDRGPKLNALAVTNSPFLRDLEPMRIAASMSVWGKAETTAELVEGMRGILEMPETATPADMKDYLEAIGVAYQNGVRPPGYPDGLGGVLDSVRRLVGLTMLATGEQIVAAAGQQLDTASASVATTPLPAAQPQGPAAMTASATPDKLRVALVALFGCVDHDDVILAEATKAKGGLAALGDLMKKYGAADHADLATKAMAARDEAAKTAEFATKLGEALAALDSGVQEEAKKDTEAVAASCGFAAENKGARTVILSQLLEARRAALGIVAEENEGKLELSFGKPNGAKLELFWQNYPKPDAKKVVLSTSIVAGQNGAQLGGPHTGLQQKPVGQQPPAGADQEPEHIAALANYPGPNPIAKAIAYLSEKLPGFKSLDWGTQNFRANQYVLTGKAA
jgi:hypothetical protein